MIEGLLQSGVTKVKSMHRVDAFRNSPGVCRKLAEGIGSLPEWRKGVCQKKIKTRRKIVGVGSRRKFTRRFAEGIGKLTGNANGDREKEDRRTCRKIARGCRSIRDLGLKGLIGH
ncbi:hypothetical protein B296_00022119 [Ensete ventricosum]|uniref:Uncharacterized protein n=1 Tax=Ensete ventricosum TaxID=4639 RepID=A0A426XKT6_ENSVE|nr:hypothetical protein B296_00022119 [Ensete ventricosum]